MPRTPRDAVLLLAGLWLSLTLMGPLGEPWAYAADPGLARLEGQLHLAVNAFRRSERLMPMERDARLDEVAREHSEDMIRRGYFSHDTPEGWNPVDRLKRAGVDGFRLAGENVGQTNRAQPNREILTGWELSPPHRANLTGRTWNATGIGIARAPDGTLFYTQLYVTFSR